MTATSRVSIVALIAGLACSGAAAFGQTSYPMIMSLKPVAAQAGTTSEHVVHSRYSLQGAFQISVSGDGVVGEVVPPIEEPTKGESGGKDKKKAGRKPNPQELKVRFSVSADALPGVREFRVATPRGVSTVGQLVIAGDPVVVENEANNRPDEAQEISVPAVVCGCIQRNEDVDFFKFTAAAGTSLCFHVRSMRLQDKIHDLQAHSDPILSLRSASGVTLATSDNDFAGDPLLSHHFDETGEYLLEIRDVRYQGNKYWEYAVEISGRPFVTTVFPLGVNRGQEIPVELIGRLLAADGESTLSIPPEIPPGDFETRLPLATGASNPVPVHVSDLPIVYESGADNNSPETAEAVPVPVGVNGRIESEGDVDCFAFDAKKGEKISVEVVARRRQSAMDSVVRLLDAQGRPQKESDDLDLNRHTYFDSWIENWSVPADGKYTVEIRDLHLRGGPAFVYFLKITRSQPYFDLYLDTDKTQLTPGTSGALFVNVVRKNGFSGEIALSICGLPDTVTGSCGRILPKGRDGCIILTAAGDAPLSLADVEVRGQATHKLNDNETLELEAVAVPYQETYRPGGGRGHWPVESHAVAVGAPSDIRSVGLSSYDVTLRPGESKRIDVTIQRAEGFTKNVTLDVMMQHLGGVFGNSLPAGVSVDKPHSKVLLTAGESQGHITLKASGKAASVDKQQVPVMANIAINFVMKATYSSRPLTLTVANDD